MTNRIFPIKSLALIFGSTMCALLLSGCASLTGNSTPSLITTTGVHGLTMGGRQPIAGASIYLYAAGTSGYSTTATNVLTQPVYTTAAGTFYIASITCTAGQQMYIVSIGGNPGAGTNPNAGIMGALGECANLGQYSFININEITTVAAAFALSPFSSGYGTVGVSSTNTAGLARAFNSAAKLANITTGFSVGTALPAGATGPVVEINTLADILAACINTTGGSATDTTTTCGRLFNYATPANGTAPADTIAAAILIAQNPTHNVTNIFNLLPSTAVPYVPQLSVAPNDWTMSINYAPTGVSSPRSTTLDANGNIWIASSGNNTITVLSQTGEPRATLTNNGLNAPAAIAIDSLGNAWVANKGGASVSAFTASGGIFTGSPFTGNSNISAPSSLALDAVGDIWISDSTGNSVTELSSSGGFLTQINTGVTTPGNVVINPK